MTIKTAKPGDRIAVIGAGISGLSAAWLLSKNYYVTVFESNQRLGGHSNTVTSPAGDAVDTGFIVYNDWTYPNLIALFDHFGVENIASQMSFAVSLRDGDLEYSGGGLAGLFAQKSNFLRPRFHFMWRDILRFYREAPAALAAGQLAGISLGDYLAANDYSKGFIEDHLLPMGAAIWSGAVGFMRDFPAENFVRFFHNHGLMLLKNRPQWRTVKGGSRVYVEKLHQSISANFHLKSPVHRVEQQAEKFQVYFADGQVDLFDHVVFACHSDQALAMIADATDSEKSTLGAMRYQKNDVFFHQDIKQMPRRKAVWSSWNYLGEQNGQVSSITYWMNNLQSIPETRPYFVTLNPLTPVNPEKIIGQYRYDHPVFDQPAIAAQSQIGNIQGRRGLWFCGAYSGFGFHEDGLSSGLAVAEYLGGAKRPWVVSDVSPAGKNVTPVAA